MKIQLTESERNILIGSILGDGSLALYGRSKNAYYREHGCTRQNPYREWKCYNLKRLGFNFSYKNNLLRSPSLEILTDLYNLFYINKVKAITDENIKLLNHPIGLACLYMDDGTLVIDSANRKNGKHLFPRISIYTLNFTKEENELLIKHLKYVFNIEFKLKKRRDGKNYILELNKLKDIERFISIVSPYVKQIPSMSYKIEIENRINKKKNDLLKNQTNIVTTANLDFVDNGYTPEEEKFIIECKKASIPYKDIASKLNRSYYGITDKIRRLKIDGRIS